MKTRSMNKPLPIEIKFGDESVELCKNKISKTRFLIKKYVLQSNLADSIFECI